MIKRWQNLIEKKCPKCGGELERKKDRGVIYECKKGDFLISQRKYFDILIDEKHIMRRFLGEVEKRELERVIETLQ